MSKRTRRKYLTPEEIKAMVRATGQMQHPIRDRAMALVMFELGLRVSELCHLSMADVSLDRRTVYVRRLKNSISGERPLRGEALRALKEWLGVRPFCKTDRVFISQHKRPFTRFGLTYLVEQWGRKANMPLRVNPHMLRHARGYDLINNGGSQNVVLIGQFLGHRDLRNTMIYVELAPGRFDELLVEDDSQHSAPAQHEEP